MLIETSKVTLINTLQWDYKGADVLHIIGDLLQCALRWRPQVAA